MTELTNKILHITAKAIARGALVPLQLETTFAQEDELQYSISYISKLSFKEMATSLQRSSGSNPFLPYEQDLFVDDLSSTHLVLLNKFAISPNHAMIVTRRFVPQASRLEFADFEALGQMMNNSASVYMFNSCGVAGASQPHRHIHAIADIDIPLAAHFPHGESGKILSVKSFRFVHAFIRPDSLRVSDPIYLQSMYELACAHCNLALSKQEMSPYNILATREWMLLVPRSQATYTVDGITVAVSALDFGGRIGVRDAEQITIVKRAGLLSLLEATAVM